MVEVMEACFHYFLDLLYQSDSINICRLITFYFGRTITTTNGLQQKKIFKILNDL